MTICIYWHVIHYCLGIWKNVKILIIFYWISELYFTSFLLIIKPFLPSNLYCDSKSFLFVWLVSSCRAFSDSVSQIQYSTSCVAGRRCYNKLYTRTLTWFPKCCFVFLSGIDLHRKTRLYTIHFKNKVSRFKNITYNYFTNCVCSILPPLVRI